MTITALDVLKATRKMSDLKSTPMKVYCFEHQREFYEQIFPGREIVIIPTDKVKLK